MSPSYEQIVKDLFAQKLDQHIRTFLQQSVRGREILQFNENNPLIKTQKHMRFERGIYTPKCDIGVGPFSFQPGNLNRLYEDLLEIPQIKRFISNLSVKGGHLGDGRFLSPECRGQNKNPRCFIAVEIESPTTSRKHFMGSVVNSSIMGKIGVVISYDETKMNRVFQFFKEMVRREKTLSILKNVIWMTKSNFDSLSNNGN